MDIQQNSCPVCQATEAKYLFPAGNGELMQCQTCKLTYFTPRPTPEELSQFYNSASYREEFQNSIMAGEDFAKARYKQLKDIIKRYAPSVLTDSHRHFLDIGCGTGDLLSVAASDGWDITGTEISPLVVQNVTTNLKNKILVGDIFSLDLPQNYYDVITIYHVIEHLLSPVDTLVKMKELLSPNGIVFIETPNIGGLGAKLKGKNWSQIFPPEHITYFNPSSLKYALKQSNFSDFVVFTASPILVESVSAMPWLFQGMGKSIYNIAPLLNLGAALQSVASK